MNIIWTGLFIVSLALCLFSDVNVISVITGASADALQVCLSLVAVYCFWCGIFEVLTASNLVEKFAKLIAPTVNKAYGKMSQEACNYVALNLSANLLGVGGAATPSALLAIEEIGKTESLPTVKNVYNSNGYTVDGKGKTENEQDKMKLHENSSNLQVGDVKSQVGAQNVGSIAENNKSTKSNKEKLSINTLLYKAASQVDLQTQTKPNLPKPIAMLFIVNATSIQLLPTTVIGLRAEFNSLAPADITLPTIICTAVTTVLGLILGNLFYKQK